MKIAVVGYGIGGIATAVSLRKLGHEITHFEQASQPGFVGAGLLLQPAALIAAKKLGVAGAVDIVGAKVFEILGTNEKGKKIVSLNYAQASPVAYGLGIQRGALFEILRNADAQFASLHASRQIVGVEADSGYLIESKGNRLGPFDLVVAADGANSMVRNSVSHLVQKNRSCSWGALVFLADDVRESQDPTVRQNFSGGRHVSWWPVGVMDASASSRINVSINVSATRTALYSDDQWRTRLALEFPGIAEILMRSARLDTPIFATYRDVELSRFFSGRVVLVGDAAHAMSPQLGQGASMALLDAVALAESLGSNSDVHAALKEYDHVRRRHVSIYQKISRIITPLFQSDRAAWVLARDRVFPRIAKLPCFERAMLRTLCGQQNGWLTWERLENLD